MNFKKQIKRILLLATWTVLGCSVLVLLVAAMNIKNHKTCKAIDVEISGVKEIFFLDEKDILDIINDNGQDKAVGKAIVNFNLRRLETILKTNVWVKDANLFFDNNVRLHVHVIEKEPIARIFTVNNSTFYIDSSGARMPLSNKMSVRLPLFTEFPLENFQLKAEDSLLMEHIKSVSLYILKSEFWMAQISQVSITPERNFEMIPTIGRHIIQFGDGENCENKFRRLFLFYKEVLSKVGIDKYSRVIVQYDKQVIGTAKGPMPKIDSLKALNNIQKMIDESRKISNDSSYRPAETFVPPGGSEDSGMLSMSAPENFPAKDSIDIKPVMPGHHVIKAGVSEKTPATRANEKPKPKAVMKKPG